MHDLNVEENITQLQIYGHSTKYITYTLQNCPNEKQSKTD